MPLGGLKDEGDLRRFIESLLLNGQGLLNVQGVRGLPEQLGALDDGKAVVPTGLLGDWHTGVAAPEGWLDTDGSAVSRVTYAALFSVIGTIYGIGDGSTTFNLPTLTDAIVKT